MTDPHQPFAAPVPAFTVIVDPFPRIGPHLSTNLFPPAKADLLHLPDFALFLKDH
jgi:hypothetical protein